MKIKHTETVQYKREITDQVICDWCGQEIPRRTGSYDEHPSTDIVFTYGITWPEGWNGKGWQVEDLCHDCGFKLRQYLENLGIKTIDYEED